MAAEPSGQTDRTQAMAANWTVAAPIVAGFLRSVIRHSHDVEDVLQEAAQQVAARYGDYDARRPFIPWALGIARLKALEHLRRQDRDRLVFSSETLDLVANGYQAQGDEINEMKSAIGPCLAAVKGRARQVLDMRYSRDMKPGDIARHLGLSANGVRVLLARTRAALGECIRRRIAEGGAT